MRWGKLLRRRREVGLGGTVEQLSPHTGLHTPTPHENTFINNEQVNALKNNLVFSSNTRAR